jgi:hypothetical protein
VIGYGDENADRVRLPVAGVAVGTFRVYVTVPREAKLPRETGLDFLFNNLAADKFLARGTVFAAPPP